MRYLILLAGILLVAAAVAEEPAKTSSKRLDKSSPAMVSTQSGDAGDKSATDASKTDVGLGQLHAEGVVHRDIAARSTSGQDHDSSHSNTRTAAPAEGADYNSSRSNKTHAPASSGQSGGAGSGSAAAQDHNSSRSNKTSRSSDAPDQSGTGEQSACRQEGRDCDDAEDDTGPRAFNQNTSRSNRSRAQDHNSSRSNKTSRAADAADMNGDGRPDLVACGNGIDQDCDAVASRGDTRAQDYNSSRSNTTTSRGGDITDKDGDGSSDLASCGNGVDQDCDGVDSRGATGAQDYNSSRSNTTTLRGGGAADMNGDGRPDLDVCSKSIDDDCDDGDSDERAVNHNSTRSNRSTDQ